MQSKEPTPFHHYGRAQHLIHLQIRTNDADLKWKPPHRFNLTGDRSIPFSTYAKFVVDTATSLGQGGDKGFFKSQAQTHIAHALELLSELSQPVTLTGAFTLLGSLLSRPLDQEWVYHAFKLASPSAMCNADS